MIRRPPRSTLSSSSAASDVYKRQRDGQPAQWADHPTREGGQALLLGRVQGRLICAGGGGVAGDGAGELAGQGGGQDREGAAAGGEGDRVHQSVGDVPAAGGGST